MDEDRHLQPLEVINYFLHEAVCFQSTNTELVGRFEKLLKSDEFGRSNHASLKRLTQKLVVVKRVGGGGRKVFELKPDLQVLFTNKVNKV